MDTFNNFFSPYRLQFLKGSIDLALAEDGKDLTSEALFTAEEISRAELVCKEISVVCGLPIISLVLQRCSENIKVVLKNEEGSRCSPGEVVAELNGPATAILKAERVILNFICHLSGIAEYTRKFSNKIQGYKTRLLDTRKTLPGLRYPEKYAVLIGGGENHRMDLEDILMLKDNHIDRSGSITRAVQSLRRAYSFPPPIEVECRSTPEVREAVDCGVDRIMLDNMDIQEIAQVLPRIPKGIETEISGGICEDNIAKYAALGATYISVGSLTHSAPSTDFSMNIHQ